LNIPHSLEFLLRATLTSEHEQALTAKYLTGGVAKNHPTVG